MHTTSRSPKVSGQTDEATHLYPEDCDRRTSVTQLSFWLVLCLVCIPLWSITPLSWLITAHAFLNTGFYTFTVLKIYCLAECMFSLYYQWLGHFCKTTKFRPPPKSMAELQGLFSRVLRTGLGEYKTERRPTLAYDDDRAADFRSHFRLWFGGRPWNQISIEDVRAWLAWSMFDQPVEDLRHKHLAGHLEAIEETLAALIDRTGGGLSGEPKRLGTVITLTWDKVNIWSRPAALYLFSESWNQLALYRLRWCYGLEKGSYRGIDYLFRKGSRHNECSPRSPIVFLHGLGFGVAQYSGSIAFLLQSLPMSQSILIPLQPNISHSILHPYHLTPLPKQEWVNGLLGIIDLLDWSQSGVTVVSHSKGSLIHSWLIKERPSVVVRSCFVDPVCFCLWEGDLAWNYVYRTPKTGMQLMLRYLTATEPGIALAVQRHFDWAASSLFADEIPRINDPYATLFVLGGEDVVINASRVKRYLAMDGGATRTIQWNPHGHHAEAILFRPGLTLIIRWLEMPHSSGS